MNKKLYLKQWQVASASSGNTHKVCLKKDRTLTCDCIGWRYRRTCRHVALVAAKKAGKSSPYQAPEPKAKRGKRP